MVVSEECNAKIVLTIQPLGARLGVCWGQFPLSSCHITIIPNQRELEGKLHNAKRFLYHLVLLLVWFWEWGGGEISNFTE